MKKLYFKFAKFGVAFKPILALYVMTFVTFGIIYDLFFSHVGYLTTNVLLQFFLLSGILSLFHFILYGEGNLNNTFNKRRIAIHLVATLVSTLLVVFGFRWMPFSGINLAIVVGVYLLFYSGLFYGFWLYYYILVNEMNQKLKDIK